MGEVARSIGDLMDRMPEGVDHRKLYVLIERVEVERERLPWVSAASVRLREINVVPTARVHDSHARLGRSTIDRASDHRSTIRASIRIDKRGAWRSLPTRKTKTMAPARHHVLARRLRHASASESSSYAYVLGSRCSSSSR